MAEVSFEHTKAFQAGDLSGDVRLGKLEGLYRELFAEAIEDGVITQEEREQLDKMADSLGLDRERLHTLEDALSAAYHAHHDEPVGVDIDVSEIAEAPTSVTGRTVPDDDAHQLLRVLEHEPRNVDILHQLFRVYRDHDRDRAFCVAHVLDYLGAANDEERSCFAANRTDVLIRPSRALDPAAWHEFLFHPEEDARVGAIFGAVVPAVLLSRLSALHRDKALPHLDPRRRQDPVKSTVLAVRCVSWAAAFFGMTSPVIHVEPERDETVAFVPAMPPVARLGTKALSGRDSGELAFLAGKSLAYFREEHVVSLLLPEVASLEEIFLAALCIGKPDLPLAPQVREWVMPLSRALESILEPAAVEHLREHVAAFIREGGRANLQHWLASVHKTAARAGLLLSNDLRAAQVAFTLEGEAHIEEKMNDLILFATSDRCAELRKRIGIAIE